MKAVDITRASSIAEAWAHVEKAQVDVDAKQMFYSGVQTALAIIYQKRRIDVIPEEHRAERAIFDELAEQQAEIISQALFGNALRHVYSRRKMTDDERMRLIKAGIADGSRNEDGTCKDPACPFCTEARTYRRERGND